MPQPTDPREARLAEIQARVDAAEAGPWSACGEDRGGCQCGQVGSPAGPICDVTRGEWGDEFPNVRLKDNPGLMGQITEPFMEKIIYGEVSVEVAAANQAFIAHAREDVPFLLELVASLIEERSAR